MKEKTQKAGTSIYFALVTMLVLSLLFTLLEGARVEGLKAAVKMDSDVATESVLAGYVSPLWEKYHIFAGNMEAVATDGSLGEEKRNGQGLWLYPMQAEGVSVEEYHLLTDEKGEGFCRLAAEYMKYHMPVAAVEAAKDKLEKMQNAKKEAGDLDAKVDNADSCMQTAKEETDANETQKPIEGAVTADNPLEYRKTWKSKDTLGLLGIDSAALSEKQADISQSVGRRKRKNGNWSGKTQEALITEQILFQEYLLQQFTFYPVDGAQAEPSERKLDYEVEYLLAGKASDRQNIKAVIKQILALREVANFVYLQTDAKKKGEALSVATLLVGATGNTLLIKGVQQGILAVWAFAESISDVRSLLSGEKIPIYKTAEQWTTDVGGLTKDSSFGDAKKCVNGLGYRDYLRLLLAMEKREKLCYRAMDLMEWNIRNVKGYEAFQMDELWDKCTLSYEYQAKPLFVSTIRKQYCWNLQRTAQYLQD